MSIKPLNYVIDLDVDLENFVFKGKERIQFEQLVPSKTITLDSLEISVSNCRLVHENYIVDGWKTDDEHQSLRIDFNVEMVAGTYDLIIEFEGEITDKLAGLYRTKYEHKDRTCYFATSQFEAADARRVFPCFDSPSSKATFDVSITIDRNLKAISNTLPFDIIEMGDKTTYHFERTPEMSTYLLYFGVGDFEFLEDRYKQTEIRVVTTPGKSEFGKAALEYAKHSLEYFEEYFDYPYILPKLDLIAVPDFAAGAMENWGAVTFRENMLLIYPGLTPKSTIMRIAEYIAHELAHQWFGNLVTMKWWDNLWLNESFATFMAYKAMSHINPEWDVWSEYVTNSSFGGMELDSLASSHPIKVEVKTVDEIDETFDKIAYEKGGSILRMLEHFIGEAAFRNGLRSYIKKYQFGNTVEKDLWTELETASELPVIDVMERFIERIGFPVVSISETENSVFLSQKRFLRKRQDMQPTDWFIPMVYKTKNADHRYLLNNKNGVFELEPGFSFIMANADYSGFYITDYSDDLLLRIGQNWDLLNNKEKLGILHDLMMLVYSGDAKLQKLTHFVDRFLAAETASPVLDFALSTLFELAELTQNQESKAAVTKLAVKSLALTGYEPADNELPSTELLRTTSFTILIKYNDVDVIKYLTNWYNKYLQDESVLPAGIRGNVYAAAVFSDRNNYDVIWRKYLATELLDDKFKLLRALGYARDTDLIQRTLESILGDDIRFSNIAYVLYPISRNAYAKDLVIPWLIKSWDALQSRAGGMGNMILQRVLQYTIPDCGIGKADSIKRFFAEKDMTGLEKTLSQSLEELEINELFVKENV
jgi:tricorn protease interacting factor F2/3